MPTAIPPTVVPPTVVPPTVVPAPPSEKPGAVSGKPVNGTAAVPPAAPQPVGRVDCSVVRCVALTFDDGPNAGTTLQIVNTLTERQIPATFFMLSSMAQANPAVVRKIAANPRFEIASHTVSHPNLTKLSASAVAMQVTSANSTLSELSGRTITLFRPPYGNHNAAVDAVVRSVGQAVIIWDVDTEDWKNRNAATTTARAVSGARSGSIILLHDIHASTAAAVPGIIDQLRARGYVFVTVSELLGPTVPGKTYLRRG
jgi:peptidoglycan/xylan/chitin deacetylase (PgdA/CDA1 family)